MEINIDDAISRELMESDNSFIVKTKNKNDILNEIHFDNDDDKKLCNSIINELESAMSRDIRDLKIVQIPFIGCVRINPVKRQLRDASKTFRVIRKNLSKEEYKEYVRDYVNELKDKQKKIDEDKLIFTRIRRNNKKKYEELYKNINKSYAEMFIYSIYLIKEVPYNEEWEEYYKTLK